MSDIEPPAPAGEVLVPIGDAATRQRLRASASHIRELLDRVPPNDPHSSQLARIARRWETGYESLDEDD